MQLTAVLALIIWDWHQNDDVESAALASERNNPATTFKGLTVLTSQKNKNIYAIYRCYIHSTKMSQLGENGCECT